MVDGRVAASVVDDTTLVALEDGGAAVDVGDNWTKRQSIDHVLDIDSTRSLRESVGFDDNVFLKRRHDATSCRSSAFIRVVCCEFLFRTT